MIHSRQVSSGFIGIETPYEQPNYSYPDTVNIPARKHLLDDEQVNSQERPVSSESGWQEAGTLSSHDDGSAMDFDEDRDKFSDGGEDEEMLDCSDGVGEEASPLLRADVGKEEREQPLGDSTMVTEHPIAAVIEQEGTPHAPFGGEVSRSFSSTTRDAAILARLASDVTAAANDSIIGSWYRSEQASERAPIQSEHITTGRESHETSGMAELHDDNHISGNTATIQPTVTSVVTEQTREAHDILSDECNRYIQSQPGQHYLAKHYLANSGSARPASPQDSGLGPFPGDFGSPSPFAKDLDDTLYKLFTPRTSQSKTKKRSAKVSRVSSGLATRLVSSHQRPYDAQMLTLQRTELILILIVYTPSESASHSILGFFPFS
jgi:hypothetical protein